MSDTPKKWLPAPFLSFLNGRVPPFATSFKSADVCVLWGGEGYLALAIGRLAIARTPVLPEAAP